jgi:pyruvate/2-oxoglutarate/acetoin dehydrogenase E1 component
MTYFDLLKESCEWLAAQSDKVIFVGQATEYPGHGISRQLVDVPAKQKLELPVAEDFQMGFCIGLALEGYIPVSIYPRWNFALLAANQLINHLDKWEQMCVGKSKPKVIIKVAAGSVVPLDPGYQHKADYSNEFRNMCDNVNHYILDHKSLITLAYEDAWERNKSCIMTEYGDMYND